MGLFGLGKKPATFGLDIGSSSIKAVELVPQNGSYALGAYATVPLPPDAIVEGAIRNLGTVAEAIRECVGKAGITSKSAVISVSGRDSIVKRVPLPKATPKELADAMERLSKAQKASPDGKPSAEDARAFVAECKRLAEKH